MIVFQKECELEVIESFDEETEIVNSVNEIFRVGEEVDAVIYDRPDNDHVSIQFGDGSVVTSLPSKWILEV